MSSRFNPIVVFLAFASVLAAAPMGCKSKTSPEPRANETAPIGDRYSVQGVVRALPVSDGKPLVILHQAIKDFRNQEGETVGMMAMPMPFRLPAHMQGANAPKLKVGDKIAFTFTIDWKDSIPTHIVDLNKLPDDTEIVFSPDEEEKEDEPDQEGEPDQESEPAEESDHHNRGGDTKTP